jgi:curved DNA-binding protein CbpA
LWSRRRLAAAEDNAYLDDIANGGVPSPYDVLGVDPDASDGEIERAYRDRLKETHPDHGGSTEEFRAVRAAYAALTDEAYPAPSEQFTPPRYETPEQPVSNVEYLDYDAIAERGWSLDDPDLFEKADEAGLDGADRGSFEVQPPKSLLEGAEACGFSWPYACRGGACANCAVAVLDGELDMPVNHILPPEQLEDRIRLSCVGVPASSSMRVVFNVKHLPGLDELRLPADRFELAQQGD